MCKRELSPYCKFFCLPHLQNKGHPTFLKSGIFLLIAKHTQEAFPERAAAERFLRISGFGGSPNKQFVTMDSHEHCLLILCGSKMKNIFHHASFNHKLQQVEPLYVQKRNSCWNRIQNTILRLHIKSY